MSLWYDITRILEKAFVNVSNKTLNNRVSFFRANQKNGQVVFEKSKFVFSYVSALEPLNKHMPS